MVKKFLSAVLMCGCVLSSVVFAQSDINVVYEGKSIVFDVPPQNINDRVMVPLRAIFETIDAKVTWSDETKTIMSIKDEKTVTMQIGNNSMWIGDEEVKLDSPPVIIDSRTLVPVRAIAESYDINVSWDDETKTVYLKNKADEADSSYKQVYKEYIKNSVAAGEDSFFSRGFILCDLNDDNIPELFSVRYGYDSNEIFFHEYKNSEMIAPTEASPKFCIDEYKLFKKYTFHENTTSFINVFYNKKTGKKALINANYYDDTGDVFDIITYGEDGYNIKDKSEKNLENMRANRDTVMSYYKLLENELITGILPRGILNWGTAEVTLDELFEEFENRTNTIEYDTVSDGEFDCYVRNVDLENKEIELFPAAHITYEEFEIIKDSKELYTINDENFALHLDEFLYNELGIATFHSMPIYEYQFNVPNEENEKSVIEKYTGNKPVKLKFSENFKVRYGVLGYDENGNPTDYESIGGKESFTADEYFPHFAEYEMLNYCKAVVQNNEIICLDVLYHP